jgi:hypothetical protein
MHGSISLVSAGFARLDDGAAGVPELAQGAVDLLRGAALQDAVIGACEIAVSMNDRSRLLGALAARSAAWVTGALGDWAGGAAELALLASLMLVSDSHGLADNVAHLLPDDVCALEQALQRAADFWAAPGRAEETAARLAAIGVERGGGAAADARFALAKAAANWEMAARGEPSVETLARAAAAAPLGLVAASNLANVLAVTDQRGAYGVAMRAFQRADSAGLAFAGARACSSRPRTR